jgi:tetratricopeptide (TPR) repeat protein
MLFDWFDSRHATEVGIALADHFAAQSATGAVSKRGSRQHARKTDPLRSLLEWADREARSLPLNFYRKARLANAFKWRLVEKGLEAAVAADVTHTLVTHLSLSRALSANDPPPVSAQSQSNADAMLRRAQQFTAEGAHAEAVTAYRAFLTHNPRHAAALNDLGAALCELGRFSEAEPYLRGAIDIKPKLASAHFNLGSALRARGHLEASAQTLTRALKLAPADIEARISLAFTLFALGKVQESKVELQRVLRQTPRHPGARLGMGQILEQEGRFDEAGALYLEILGEAPNSVEALCGILNLRKGTAAEAVHAQRLEEILSKGVSPQLEPSLHFALGKYYDDIGEFRSAFQHFRNANELLKVNADGYDREAHRQMVDDLIRVYTSAATAPTPASSRSDKPVFVVGMPRSGTSLVEQIIASHPAAVGAGELNFWTAAMQRHEATLRRNPPDESLKTKLSAAYLNVLAGHSRDALRVVDKAPINADYLGLIHSVFPQARVIYVQRNPIDTCLSCYFQQFSSALAFTMDLSDLCHYYQQHHRLMAHWRNVLPQGTILDVRYEDLISDQEHWTRKIVDFLGLEWDPRCLEFHLTQRTVATASARQVRQRIYRTSVERWRNYEKFIGPLQKLECLTEANQQLTHDVAD